MPRLNDNHFSPLDTLEHVLAEQQTIGVRLTSLLDRQRALIEAGDGQGLLSLLTERQQLIDRLLATQDALQQSLSAFERERPTIDQARRKRIEAAMDAVSALLAKVMNQDSADQALLVQSRSAVRDELGRLGTSHKAHAAYGRAAQRGSRYTDHKG